MERGMTGREASHDVQLSINFTWNHSATAERASARFITFASKYTWDIKIEASYHHAQTLTFDTPSATSTASVFASPHDGGPKPMYQTHLYVSMLPYTRRVS